MFAMDRFGNAGAPEDLIYAAVLLIAIAGSYFWYNRLSFNQTLQSALVWAMIFLGAVGIYGMWDTISKNLSPNQTLVSEAEISVPRDTDGHFYLTLKINDVPVEFLVDTGASDLVLTKQDAQRVGISVDDLAFLGTAQTANGEVRIARTQLDKVELGQFLDHRVFASVNGGAMRGSLLGMSYLSRFDALEIGQNRLTLRR